MTDRERTDEQEERFKAAYQGAIALMDGLPWTDAFDVMCSLVATMAVNARLSPVAPNAEAVCDVICDWAKDLINRERGKEH